MPTVPVPGHPTYSLETNVIAGQPGAPGTDVSGAALSAVFNTIDGVGISTDGNTIYVLEQQFGPPDAGSGYFTQTIRKIDHVNDGLPTTVTSTWATTPSSITTIDGTFTVNGISNGQIRVGASGRVYVVLQLNELFGYANIFAWSYGPYFHSISYGNIAYFNPDGSFGDVILRNACVLDVYDSPLAEFGGFDFTPDEQTFFYSWTDNPVGNGNWNNLFIGRIDIGSAQIDNYIDMYSMGYRAFFLGPPSQFAIAAGMWFDDTTGRLWWTDAIDTFRYVKVFPSVDYTDQIYDPGGSPLNTSGNQFFMRGVQGFNGLDDYVAYVTYTSISIYRRDNPFLNEVPFVIVAAGVGLEYTSPSDTPTGGGFMASGNGYLYYHDQGAVWSLRIIKNPYWSIGKIGFGQSDNPPVF